MKFLNDNMLASLDLKEGDIKINESELERLSEGDTGSLNIVVDGRFIGIVTFDHKGILLEYRPVDNPNRPTPSEQGGPGG